MKKCPYCAEEIQDGAKKCRYCGEWIEKKGKLEEIKKTAGYVYDKVNQLFLNQLLCKDLRQERQKFKREKLEEQREEEEYEKNREYHLDLSHDTWYASMTLCKNQICFCDIIDCDQSESIYEYKIDGFNVYSILLEQYNEDPIHGKEYDIKDGIVLESEIIERAENRERFGYLKDETGGIILERIQEKIDKLKEAACTWHEIEDKRIKYFILLCRNPDILSKQEFKKYIKSEIERIKLGLLKVKELLNKYGIELVYNKEEKRYERKYNDYDKNNNSKLNTGLEQLLKQTKCERDEVFSTRDIELLNCYLRGKKIGNGCGTEIIDEGLMDGEYKSPKGEDKIVELIINKKELGTTVEYKGDKIHLRKDTVVGDQYIIKWKGHENDSGGENGDLIYVIADIEENDLPKGEDTIVEVIIESNELGKVVEYNGHKIHLRKNSEIGDTYVIKGEGYKSKSGGENGDLIYVIKDIE